MTTKGKLYAVGANSAHQHTNRRKGDMMPTSMEKVREFHEKFDVPIGGEPHLPSTDDFAFRYGFLREELLELHDAYAAGDLVKFADALIDLEYVLHGLGLWAGFGDAWDELHDEVHRSNMAKVKAETTAHSQASTGRGHAKDVVKPAGWRPPDLGRIIERWRT